MSETDLSPLSSINSTPRQKPHLVIIPTTPMGSFGAHTEQLTGALAQNLQQTSSSSRVVETQLEGGMDLTLKIGTQKKGRKWRVTVKVSRLAVLGVIKTPKQTDFQD